MVTINYFTNIHYISYFVSWPHVHPSTTFNLNQIENESTSKEAKIKQTAITYEGHQPSTWLGKGFVLYLEEHVALALGTPARKGS